jgi:hypothetical protein
VILVLGVFFLLEVSGASSNGLAKVALSLLIALTREWAQATIARRKVPAKEKFETFLQAGIVLEKFHLFTSGGSTRVVMWVFVVSYRTFTEEISSDYQYHVSAGAE